MEFYGNKGENGTVGLRLSLYIALWGPQEKREFSLSVAGKKKLEMIQFKGFYFDF